MPSLNYDLTLPRSTRSRRYAFLLIASVSLCRATAAAEPSHVQAPQLARAGMQERAADALTPGVSAQNQIREGDVFTHTLSLTENAYGTLVVAGRGVDLHLTLLDPRGNTVVERDAPAGDEVSIPFVAEAAGIHTLSIRIKSSGVGSYDVCFTGAREATPQELMRATAERLVAEAERVPWQAGGDAWRAAVERYQEARTLWAALGERFQEARALHALGGRYYSSPEKEKGLRALREATAMWRTLGDRGREGRSVFLIGRIYYAMGDISTALQYYEEALPLIHESGNLSSEAALVNEIGHAYDTLGDYQRAYEYFDECLRMTRLLPDPIGEGEGITVNNIGHALFGLKRYQQALDAYNQALPLRAKMGDPAGEGQTLGNIGLLYYTMGDLTRAVEYYDRALVLARTGNNPDVEATALYRAATAERDLGNVDAARFRIEAALSVIESERSQLTDFELRAYFFAGRQDYYALYTDVLMRLHERDPKAGFDAKAFEASERGRARTLLETLSEAIVDVREGADPTLLERERNLRQKRDAAVEAQFLLLSGTPTKEQTEEAAHSVNSLTAEHREVQAQIRRASPRYASLALPQTASLAEVQRNLLDRNTVLLEYSLGEKRSYLWVVTPDSFTGHALPPRRELETATTSFLKRLTGRSTPADVNASAATLGRMLLGPAAARLSGKRLAIVADGVLEYLPFAALADPANRHAVVPLVVNHEIARLPSVSTLASLRTETAGHAPAPKRVAVLADPVFSIQDERLASIRKPAQPTEVADAAQTIADATRHVDLPKRGGGLDRLLASRREAEKIAALVPRDQAKVALGFDASLQAALAPDLRQYRIVHFATHGIVNTTRPEMSGLVLSLVDDKGQAKDGFLSLARVYTMKLSADLVVLSACQTGLGTEIRGEGLVGLTRGFMYAGSPRVVASLWEVQDESTSELMTRFYRAMLTRKLSPAAALREAQISMWREPRWRSPRQWAGFVFQGEWR